MGYIYKITNTVNDKVYIGQTVQPLRYRFKRHLYDANRYDSAIYRAMKKHGFDNFSISLIEEVDDELLDEREIYWIEKFDSYKNGYNSTIGGMGNKKFNNHRVRSLWDEGYSSGEIQKIVGCGKGAVRAALVDYENYSQEESSARGQRNTCVPVAQYSLDGQLLQVFDKITDAVGSISGATSTHSITKVCREEKGTAYGYQWRYAGDKIADRIDSTIINAGSNRIIEIDGKPRGLREACLSLFGELGERAYTTIKNYAVFSGCSTQESFERYIKTNGATRSGDVIVYNGETYFDMASASRAAGISVHRVHRAKCKLNLTPQEAFDYCLAKPPGNHGPVKVCVGDTTYRTVEDAIKGSGVSRTKVYAYRKQTGCTPQEAIEHLLASA